jgi:hypothetical protein
MVRKIKKFKKGKKREEAALKRTRLQFQMLSAEVLESEIILDECIFDFNERFETGRKQEIIEEEEAQELAKSNKTFEDQEFEKQKQREENKANHEEILPEDKDLKDLFKKIALKTHPDKLADEEPERAEYLTELYKDAAGAAEIGDGMALLEIAYELNIKVKIDPEKETEWLNKKIEMLQMSIQDMKSTAEWIWGHSDGADRERVESMIQSQLGLKIKES